MTLDQVSGCGIFKPLSQGGCYCPECKRGEGCAVDDDQVTLCKRWIVEHVTPAKRAGTVFGCWGSYGLKHVVEQWARETGTGGYVANGAFIVAAIALGFEAVQTGAPSINCRFRMKAKRATTTQPAVAGLDGAL